MQQRIADGLKLNKTQHCLELGLKHRRTPEAWRYRMQNISDVLDQHWKK